MAFLDRPLHPGAMPPDWGDDGTAEYARVGATMDLEPRGVNVETPGPEKRAALHALAVERAELARRMAARRR